MVYSCTIVCHIIWTSFLHCTCISFMTCNKSKVLEDKQSIPFGSATSLKKWLMKFHIRYPTFMILYIHSWLHFSIPRSIFIKWGLVRGILQQNGMGHFTRGQWRELFSWDLLTPSESRWSGQVAEPAEPVAAGPDPSAGPAPEGGSALASSAVRRRLLGGSAAWSAGRRKVSWDDFSVAMMGESHLKSPTCGWKSAKKLPYPKANT